MGRLGVVVMMMMEGMMMEGMMMDGMKVRQGLLEGLGAYVGGSRHFGVCFWIKVQ